MKTTTFSKSLGRAISHVSTLVLSILRFSFLSFYAFRHFQHRAPDIVFLNHWSWLFQPFHWNLCMIPHCNAMTDTSRHQSKVNLTFFQTSFECFHFRPTLVCFHHTSSHSVLKHAMISDDFCKKTKRQKDRTKIKKTKKTKKAKTLKY